MGAEHHAKVGSGEWFLDIGVIVGLVIFAGLMSGLTLGLMSLSLMELEVLKRSGSPTEKKQAGKLLPVVSNQHRLLVTLLLCNACAMEALPIFIDKLVDPLIAIIISVTLVLIFGEVLPQAACVRYGLAIGTSLRWLVRFLMILCLPITYPVAKLLDWILGSHDSGIYRRAQLKALVTMHGKEAGQGGDLTFDETNIISGALDLTHKNTEQAMTPVESIFSLSVETKLNKETMQLIVSKGHSRVPVFVDNPKHIIGLILVKNLITVQYDDDISVGKLQILPVPRVPADMKLYHLLDEFQKGGSHMAVVVKNKNASKNIHPSPLGDADRSSTPNPSGSPSHAEQPESTPPTDSGKASPVHTVDIKHFSEDVMAAKDIETGGTNNNHHRTTSPEREPRGLGKKKLSRHNIAMQLEELMKTAHEDEDVIGIITLEDVIEELLQEEIVDETDVYVDVHNKVERLGGLPRLPSFPRKLLGSPERSRHGKKGGKAKESIEDILIKKE